MSTKKKSDTVHIVPFPMPGTGKPRNISQRERDRFLVILAIAALAMLNVAMAFAADLPRVFQSTPAQHDTFFEIEPATIVPVALPPTSFYSDLRDGWEAWGFEPSLEPHYDEPVYESSFDAPPLDV